ncbi:uncharacterized protein ACOB8E_023242 isoform 2-T2 [Sarcophilus harrisii]
MSLVLGGARGSRQDWGGMGVSCRQLQGLPSAQPCVRPSGQTSIHKCLWSERLNKMQGWPSDSELGCLELLTLGDVAVTSKETPVPFSAGSVQGCDARQPAEPGLPELGE